MTNFIFERGGGIIGAAQRGEIGNEATATVDVEETETEVEEVEETESTEATATVDVEAKKGRKK